MNRKTFVVFAILAIVVVNCAILPLAALGQAAYGNIIGTVTDNSGAAVAGAQVTVTDVGKGVTRTVITNDSGNYSASNLTPGNYTVAIEAKSFKKFLQENLPVIVGTSSTLNATLQVGAATESVTVT